MSELNQTIMEMEFLQEEIAELQEMYAVLLKRKLELETTAAETDNPFWEDDGDDPYHGRFNKDVNRIRDAMLASGNRGEKYVVDRWDVFNSLFVVTLAENMEDVSHDYLGFYSREQNEQFPGAMVGSLRATGFTLDHINLIDGTELPGYLIPWAGNAGPIEARKRFEAYWSAPGRLKSLTAQAARIIRRMDFYYDQAVRNGAGEQYLADNPHYVPPTHGRKR